MSEERLAKKLKDDRLVVDILIEKMRDKGQVFPREFYDWQPRHFIQLHKEANIQLRDIEKLKSQENDDDFKYDGLDFLGKMFGKIRAIIELELNYYDREFALEPQSIPTGLKIERVNDNGKEELTVTKAHKSDANEEHKARIDYICMFGSILYDLIKQERDWHDGWETSGLFPQDTDTTNALGKFAQYIEDCFKYCDLSLENCQLYLNDLSLEWHILPPPLMSVHDCHIKELK